MPLIDVAYMKRWISEDTLLGLTASEANPHSINEDIINAAIERAHGKLYGKLNDKYKYPFEGADPALNNLKGIEFSLAKYYLYSTKYEDEQLEDIYTQHNKAISELTQYADGRHDPGIAKVTGEVSLSFGTNKTSSDRRIEWL